MASFRILGQKDCGAPAIAVVGIALVLSGCAVSSHKVADGDAQVERIVEVTSGRTVTREELLDALRASDYVLLGELHDNPLHHRRRGELLAALQRPATVIAEQLPRGERLRFTDDLEASLVAAGFAAKQWRWPLHEPLFAAVRGAGLPLAGGNVPIDDLRRVAREGEAALPPPLAAVIAAAPLTDAAQRALDADLERGHCGQLPPTRLPSMRLAQRARDASMTLALEDAGGRPAVLLAGNGHVRGDYGVPQLLAQRHPQARITSVAFAEPGAALASAPYAYVWVTAPAEREDPCAGFKMPSR